MTFITMAYRDKEPYVSLVCNTVINDLLQLMYMIPVFETAEADFKKRFQVLEQNMCVLRSLNCDPGAVCFIFLETQSHKFLLQHYARITLVMCSANVKRRYHVTPSLVGRAHAQVDLWLYQATNKDLKPNAEEKFTGDVTTDSRYIAVQYNMILHTA